MSWQQTKAILRYRGFTVCAANTFFTSAPIRILNVFFSSSSSDFLTDHFCLFMSSDRLYVCHDDRRRLRCKPLPVWSHSNSPPAADWCALIFSRTRISDASDRLMLARMTGRRQQHVTGVLRNTMTSCTGNTVLCRRISLAWSQLLVFTHATSCSHYLNDRVDGVTR